MVLMQRIPYLVEDTFHINMNYYCAKNVPLQLITSEPRRLIKAGELGELKKLVYGGSIEIDDPIDMYSKHTLLHDAVMLNREEEFEFVMKQGANPMVRDVNGYTPLLKAAALGRLDMVKYLVDRAEVDPRHVDPYGNTPRMKA